MHAARFADQQRQLSVLHIYPKKLEDVRGVDLIFYRQDIDAFLVIHSRIATRGSRGRWSYDADPIFEAEHERLERLIGAPRPASPQSLAAYRFNPAWCYYKFCPIDTVDGDTSLFARSAYVPFDFFKLYRRSPEGRGGRGGLRVTQTIQHLDASSFVHLAESGWIGSQGDISAKIGTLVRKKLQRKYQHSVLLASLVSDMRGQQILDI